MSALNQQEWLYLQNLQQRAIAAGQLPQQVALPGPGMAATLNPPNTTQRLINGVPFDMVRLGDPIAWLPFSPSIAWMSLDNVANITNETANTSIPVRLSFDVPTVIYKIAAAVRNTAGAAIGGQFGNVLDTFTIQVSLTGSGRLFQTTPVSGSTICGTAEFPRILDIPWRFDPGATLQVSLTPLIANLLVDVVFYAVQLPGATNITAMP